METENRFKQMGRVKEIKGSILHPHDAGLRFVLNINNMAGKAESPLYPIFEKKWKKVKEEAKGWYNTRTGLYKLGVISDLSVNSDVWVIGMLCQDENLQTNVVALTNCLKEVCKLAKFEKASVHVSNLLVNAIPELKDTVMKQLVEQGISVSFYEEPNVWWKITPDDLKEWQEVFELASKDPDFKIIIHPPIEIKTDKTDKTDKINDIE